MLPISQTAHAIYAKLFASVVIPLNIGLGMMGVLTACVLLAICRLQRKSSLKGKEHGSIKHRKGKNAIQSRVQGADRRNLP